VLDETLKVSSSTLRCEMVRSNLLIHSYDIQAWRTQEDEWPKMKEEENIRLSSRVKKTVSIRDLAANSCESTTSEKVDETSDLCLTLPPNDYLEVT
jgi:hypothetical protein